MHLFSFGNLGTYVPNGKHGYDISFNRQCLSIIGW
jgi:hypothetical protein